MTAFNLPDLGEGLREAEIVAWHIAEGDHVVVDQPLVSVETEKAVVEIPSPQSGHIAKLLARAGEHVQVGAPLLLFEEGPHAETGTVVGELAPPPPPAEPPRQAVAEPAAHSPAQRVSPAVRARAHALGVNLINVKPTGPDATITMADLDKAATAPAQGPQALRGARRAMAANMAKAGREAVPATLYDDADIDAWNSGEDVTTRLIRAIVAGCAAEPSLNASFDAATLSLRHNARVDLGLAIDDPDGLFVPVLRDAGGSGPESWRHQIDAMKTGVKERRLTPAELRDPTITLSNFGTIGGRYAALVIVPPQVAILGAGRTRDSVARGASGIALRRTMPLSLTFDHRAITGGEAARFLRAVIDDLQKPR
jgi:2-oxoisovalerate dehydrogenase E2 component (dihydrolipoyl transacylase)